MKVYDSGAGIPGIQRFPGYRIGSNWKIRKFIF
jgi:hypothetical protein